MASELLFEICVSKNDFNYLKIRDPKRVEEISQNLEKDPVWGWCIPEVRLRFDKFIGIAQLANVSYASEEDFKASPDCELLKEQAIEDMQWWMNQVQKAFEKEVIKYYESRSETKPD